MSVNWNRIIQDQMRGVDPVTAFYKEEERCRKERRERMEQMRNNNSENPRR